MRKLIISIPEDSWNDTIQQKVEALTPHIRVAKMKRFGYEAILITIGLTLYFGFIGFYLIFGTSREGEIKALSGQSKLYLVMQPDSTTRWESK